MHQLRWQVERLHRSVMPMVRDLLGRPRDKRGSLHLGHDSAAPHHRVVRRSATAAGGCNGTDVMIHREYAYTLVWRYVVGIRCLFVRTTLWHNSSWRLSARENGVITKYDHVGMLLVKNANATSMQKVNGKIREALPSIPPGFPLSVQSTLGFARSPC